MLFPPLLVPPSEARVDTWYCTFGFVFACVCARVAAQHAAIKIVKHVRLAFLVMN